LNEETIIEEDFSQILQEFSYDIFSPVIEEKNKKTTCHSLKYAEVFCSPIFDKYSYGEEKIHTSNVFDLNNNQSVYDNYESDFDEIFSSSIKEQHYDEINHSVFAEDIEQQEKVSFDGH
jgi:hypothetical protein